MITITVYTNNKSEAEKMIGKLFDLDLIAFGEMTQSTTFYEKSKMGLEKKDMIVVKMMTRALFFNDIIEALKKQSKSISNIFAYPLTQVDMESATVIRSLKEK